MKIVNPHEVGTRLTELLEAVEKGEEVVIVHDGKRVAELAKPRPINREPGTLTNHPAWKDFRYDPSIFAALETDEELAAEGWPT